ncbi:MULTISPECIES: AbrB/MazE/SpoVT family DNA-binding domain-containing protein [Aerococcus]|uniref:AbrB/MazE/SpoVT family DNA-binding domain-containing protein n=1 Tax=Aerococcus urinae TaxID=1376 RepID=A0A178HDW3_9LACT|nr:MULTISPECIES: AbrB/MazE/SpoVT family DNA-binding domain-containing protein [Aerococcus]KAA9218303.1 AbrB/MazE/SpoVT family DNA-binding domain-containing protein [Aerococcus loyolae]KAA9263930.1 AbrB/MazE/SpoVT family DNA-binding domain-containing protein [Aerococcus loyolae]MCY3027886.1 AbrB/MazE/SpoVT family DNA-binding domain-containing protein [Aerococcus loyolae]MCY3029858.1 AbrB/MazE/SpoVT family DNA-binding domain-containing protein [Aerococcus loyolae]MDK6258651.1 AbrB/MazE/SpoVT fam
MPLTINKWGNSSAIRLPKQLLEELNLSQGDKLDYQVKDGQLIIKKITEVPELTVKDLFENYDGDPVNEKPQLFEQKGNEKW